MQKFYFEEKNIFQTIGSELVMKVYKILGFLPKIFKDSENS